MLRAYFLLLFLGLSSSACQNQSDPAPPPPAAAENSKTVTGETPTDPFFTPTARTNTPDGPQAITRNIRQVEDGTIWLATFEGLLSYDGKTFTNHNNRDIRRPFRAFDLLEDRDGHLWITTIGDGVYHYDGKTFTRYATADGLPNDRVGHVYEDSNGIIWFGTETGLSRFDAGNFQNFTTANGLPDHDINAVLERPDGTYWIGARGLAATFDGENFSLLERPDGGTFSNVRTILEDRDGTVWLGGNSGLWRYGSDGFTQVSDRFTGYLYQDRAGNLWAAAEKTGVNGWTLERYPAKELRNPQPRSVTIDPGVGMLFGIHEDREGNIWVGTLRGVGRYDGEGFEYFRSSAGEK